MNHGNDHFDALVDQAARQLVEHDPPQRLHAAVMSEIRGIGDRRRAFWPHWSLIASAAAALMIAIVLWNQPRQDVARETSTQPQVVAGVPAPAESQVRSRSSTPARVSLRREGQTAGPGHPVVGSEPQPLIAAIEVRQLHIDSVRIETIATDPLAVPAIRIPNIDIDSP